MSVWFSSDQHFQHDNIIKFGRGEGRFNSINHHDMVLQKNWFNSVADDDEIYILGDSAMGDSTKSLSYFQYLPGIKFFIPGNHDHIFSGNSANHVQRWWKTYEDAGLIILPEVHHMMIDTTEGSQEVILSHFPYAVTQHENIRDKFKKYRPTFTGLPLIHGHTHSSEALNRDNVHEYHVGVDAHNFTPVPLNTIVEWLNVTDFVTKNKNGKQ